MIPDSLRHFFVSDTFSWLSCGGIVATAIVTILIFFVRSSQLATQLKRGRAILRTVATPRAFAERFEEVSHAITTRCPRLGHAWSEFSESLRQPDPDTDDPRITNSRQPILYFNDSAIIAPAVHPSFYGAMPNKLVGLGILGTFLGLAAGIGLASGQLVHEDVAEVKKGLAPLLDGASLAFLTSICGLLSSILFSAVYRWRLGRLRRQLQDFNDAMERVVVLQTSEQLGALQLDELRRQSAALDQFNTELAINIGSAVTQQLSDQLAPRLDALVAALESIRADRRDANLETLGSMVAQFQQRLDASAGDHFKSLVPVLEQLARNVEASSGGLQETTKHLNEASARMMQSVEVTTHRSHDSLEKAASGFNVMSERNEELFLRIASLAQTLENSQGSVQGIHGKLEELTGSIGSSSQILRAAAQAQVNAVEFVRTAANQVIERADRQDANIEMLAHLIGTFQQGVTSSTGNIAAMLGSNLEKFGVTLGSTLAGLRQTTTQLHERSSTQIERLEESTARSNAAMESALAGFEVLTRRHDEMFARLNALAGAIEGSQSSVQGVHARLENLAASVNATTIAFRDIANAQTKSIEHVREATVQIASTTTQTQKDWSEYRQRFEGLDQSLGRTFDVLKAGLDGYTQQVLAFTHELDQQVAKAIGDLGGAIGQLHESIEDLQHTMHGRAA